MLRDFVIVGDKIEVKQLDAKGIPIKTARFFTSQLLDIVDETLISIAMPQSNGILIKLHPEETYQLCFYTAKGLFQCNCTMVKAYKENKIAMAIVRLTSELEKLQRRQYYRLECILEIEYRIIKPEEIALEKKLQEESYGNAQERTEIRKTLNRLNQEWNKASITDISGGGAKFTSNELLTSGDNIRIKLDIIVGKQIRNLVIRSNIIASHKILDQAGKYEHRTEFVDISDKDREDLIKYIFEQERLRRQKR